MSVIEFKQVSLSRGGRLIFDRVDLVIGEREFIGVLGANGAGKTTLMRMVLGVLAPDAGAISVLGKPPSRGSAAIGYMPQVRNLPSVLRLTGRDLVASAWRGHQLGVPWLDRQGRDEIDRVLDLVGAGELARRPLLELSGGERQRLLLAETLLGKPSLLMLDEPLISLDPGHQQAVVDLTHRIQQELGISVLFSAHEISPLLGVIDRVLYLGHGRAALGTVDEVINGPVLSKLYHTDIEVIHVGSRVFVMAGNHDVEHDDHRHQDATGAGHDGHDHAHHH